tara:strand:- start:222 stop:509 length:288 start_codon:yes stop_codon:yes gene_type:complete
MAPIVQNSRIGRKAKNLEKHFFPLKPDYCKKNKDGSLKNFFAFEYECIKTFDSKKFHEGSYMYTYRCETPYALLPTGIFKYRSTLYLPPPISTLV